MISTPQKRHNTGNPLIVFRVGFETAMKMLQSHMGDLVFPEKQAITQPGTQEK